MAFIMVKVQQRLRKTFEKEIRLWKQNKNRSQDHMQSRYEHTKNKKKNAMSD